ncbi:STAS domain-containing protein [Amycolatopsis thermophila]|uniref:Anti-sigma factor antagonist n=1 Tax=Amycolatopsis thermophila TaxID=206084 RepID=A0ABU0EZA5_9PSEU|nr:STAS domain-containing protein [Amycolatopsis thermophila]MDQ0380643.1 anti-anti-sigma factor [Amycolatopsis thermophila]
MSVRTSADGLLTVRRETRAPAVVLHVTGEVDFSSLGHLQEEFSTAVLAASPPGPVVLDLEEVGFFGWCGLTMLVNSDDRCTRNHTPLRVVAASATVLQPLKLAGLDRVLPIYPDVGSALAENAPVA